MFSIKPRTSPLFKQTGMGVYENIKQTLDEDAIE
ncbi:MAG: hypothetical protein ACI808_001504 [Paraglaciecola sp.]|jgi:hypothetical protein